MKHLFKLFSKIGLIITDESYETWKHEIDIALNSVPSLKIFEELPNKYQFELKLIRISSEDGFHNTKRSKICNKVKIKTS